MASATRNLFFFTQPSEKKGCALVLQDMDVAKVLVSRWRDPACLTERFHTLPPPVHLINDAKKGFPTYAYVSAPAKNLSHLPGMSRRLAREIYMLMLKGEKGHHEVFAIAACRMFGCRYQRINLPGVRTVAKWHRPGAEAHGVVAHPDKKRDGRYGGRDATVVPAAPPPP